MESDSCLKENLLRNKWATATDLIGLSEVDKKTKLIKELHKRLNSSIHTIPDLSFSDITGPKMSLCGMAAMYRALYSTVLTKTVLSTIAYDPMRAKIFEEIDEEEDKAIIDKVLLEKYQKSNVGLQKPLLFPFC